MGNFNMISADAFNELQLGAGVILSEFDPDHPDISEGSIVCATTGGISISCVPSYTDLGADIDNCPNNLIELKKLDGWECKMSFTALSITADNIALALGQCMVSPGKSSKAAEIIPCEVPNLGESTKSLWWVGERSDGAVVAAEVKRALSTGGFNLKTTKNGKGQLNVEVTGHTAWGRINEAPMLFYVYPDR